MEQLKSEFQTTRRVEFPDTDMAGIVHFSNFFRYMESCEHAFYRSLDFPIHGSGDDADVGWPRVHASFDYFAPLQYDDEAVVHLVILEVKSRTIRYACRILRPDGKLAALGRLTVVPVIRIGGKLQATTIPDALASQIQAATPERLAELNIPEG